MLPLASIPRRLFGQEKALTAVGILGLALAGGCGAAALFRGTPVVEPGGDLIRAVSFDGAVGLWVLTIAALLPYSGFGSRVRRIWRISFVVTMLVFYFGETFAAVRGHDPRFFSGFPLLDQVVATLFGLTAGIVILQFLVFGASFFTRRASDRASHLTTGVRWAVAANVVALGVGIWMIVMQGRAVGEGGSAIWSHAIGFHALQAVPLVGWLAGRSGESRTRARGRVHAAGALWLMVTVGALVQAAQGLPPFAPAPASAASAAALAGWLVVLAGTLRAARPSSPSRALAVGAPARE